MADGVEITAGTGTEISTDDCGAAGHVQIVKLAIATDGSATPIPADGTDGILVNLGANNDVTITSGTVTAVTAITNALPAGTNSIGYVVPAPVSARIAVAASGLTTATTAYIAGDVVGAEMSFANAARASGGTGVVLSATLVDKAKVLGATRLFLFRAASTPAADNAANSWSDANMIANIVGVIDFPSPVVSALNNVASVANIGLGYDCAATTLFGVLITLTGHTFFGAADDIQITLHVLKD